MINILCPTKSRPNNVSEVYQSWKDTTDGKSSQLIFVIDPCSISTYPLGYTYFHTSRESNGVTKAMNEAFAYYSFGHNMFIGDDHRFRTPGWDTIFNSHCDDKFAILYGNDLLQGERLPTQVCMSRKIVDALDGIMQPSVLNHFYGDDFWLSLGRATNTIKYFNDIVIEHCHHCVGKAKIDDQYKANDVFGTADGQAFHQYINSDEYYDIVKRINNAQILSS